MLSLLETWVADKKDEKLKIVERKDFYIYVYFCADGSPLYVGKGRGQRWLQHMQPGYVKLANGYLRAEIIKAGGSLPVVKIREGLTNEEALNLEVAMIKAIGRGRKGPLVNLTDGGEGWAGLEKTPEHKAAIGAKSRGLKHTPESRAKMQAAHLTKREETRARVGAYHANMTPEEKANRAVKISERTKEKMTPEVCAIISSKRAGQTRPPTRGRTGMPHTDETRQKMADKWAERKANGYVKPKHTEATKAKMSASQQRNAKAKRDGAADD